MTCQRRPQPAIGWQNAAVHYHEAFWLIVGGVAPVVVLAVIVAATNEMQMAITLNVKLLFSYRFYETQLR